MPFLLVFMKNHTKKSPCFVASTLYHLMRTWVLSKGGPNFAMSHAGGHLSILFLLVSDHGLEWLSTSLSCCHYGTRDFDGAQSKMRR